MVMIYMHKELLVHCVRFPLSVFVFYFNGDLCFTLIFFYMNSFSYGNNCGLFDSGVFFYHVG